MAKVTHKAESLHSHTEAERSPDDFQTIYREHYATIWRFLIHLGVRKSDVPDVTHNVFLIAYRKLGGFEHRSSVRTWLCGIALRVARDLQKSAAVRLEVTESEVPVGTSRGSSDSVDALHQKQQLALAERLLDALPAEQREVFVLHELEQLTGPEIAELMGSPLNTVRTRLKRARDTFRQRVAALKEQGLLDV